MFSGYAGSLEADTYCPERQGMSLGCFGMKTVPAMGKPDDSISTSITGPRPCGNCNARRRLDSRTPLPRW